MKAVAAAGVFALSINAAPVALQYDGWHAFQAYTYADRGHRLFAQRKWQQAAQAYAAAYARDPRNISYLQMAQTAAAAMRPKPPPPAPPTMQPPLLLPVAHAQPKYALIALAPTAGSARTLVADTAGRYWGPVVRLAEPAPQPLAMRAVETAATPAALLLRSEPMISPSPATEKRLSLQAGFSYRPAAPTLSSSEALLGRGGSWTSAAARVNGNAARPLALTGFLYSAQSQQGFGVDPKSLQAGVSLRWQPHPAVSVEAGRLIKIGAQARNDWMLRAGIGFGAWQPADLSKNHWLHWQARADAALIGVSRRDVFAQADARLGLGVRLNDRASITPYIGSTATLQKDTRTATLLEASPGLWLHLEGRVPLDARLEYRQKLAGSAASSNGVALTLGFAF